MRRATPVGGVVVVEGGREIAGGSSLWLALVWLTLVGELGTGVVDGVTRRLYGDVVRVTFSRPAGVALGAVSIVVSTLAAIWVSGHFRVFLENRGLLQLLVAIPMASLTTAGCLAFWRLLTVAQMLWSMVPIAVLVLFGIAVVGPGTGAWYWALAVSVVVFVPWVTGALIGSAMRRLGSPHDEPAQ